MDIDATSELHLESAGSYPLTEKCHHYTSIGEVPWDIQKYWQQRYSIFSGYDEGIYMTDNAWYEVTPEPVASKLAEDLANNSDESKTVLIDMFAGVGGNVIAFAMSERWSNVIAIEKDPSTIACAQHNAEVYGVRDRITWVNDDCFNYLRSSTGIDPSKTVVFASPPWGGPGYSTDAIFNLNTMQPYSAKEIRNVCRSMDCALYLPRTSDLRQIAMLVPTGKKIEVVQYCMEGASKALVAYIPAQDD
ncbi:RNA cap guanine-N2 methyltransferase [Xylogone sp. PMI_703]|nr:RNA cap guanine-N2 methyltransferase [Xylogone sp. PMI_703]